MNEEKGIDKQLAEALKKAIELTDKVEEAGSDQNLVDLGDALVDSLGGCEAGPRRRRR